MRLTRPATGSRRTGAPFESVLIANRGEIAVRIMRTCRRLGIRTVAVYSDVDRNALHVREADLAVRIGPGEPSGSYLAGDVILRAATQTSAQAIHPGYGFLAENSEFAQACLDAGFAWVGPSPAAMRTLGDKALAKQLAEESGVPILRGYRGEAQDSETMLHQAQQIGYPIMIKARAGGGGRGLRAVHTASEFARALGAAQREGLASFGDDRVLLERYVPQARHLEVQILGDRHGHLVHLGERDCSIQRRNQKLVEESPSPAVSPALRERLGEAALTLARAASYSNAGTVEFLLDENLQYAFLEVNARLQVEHPVTEMVSGLDLVEEQLRIAAGEALSFSQSDVRLSGHAIEVRVLAEDPFRGFLPSAGLLTRFEAPPGVRTDTGFAAGDVVPTNYDSLLAKIIVEGRTREQALDRMAAALGWADVGGVDSNLDLLLGVLAHPDFRAGRFTTAFLEATELVERLSLPPGEVVAAAAAADWARSAPLVPGLGQPPPSWRLGRLGQPSEWVVGQSVLRAEVTESLTDETLTIDVGEREHVVRIGPTQDGEININVDGVILRVKDLPNGTRREVQMGSEWRWLRRRLPPGVDETAGGATGAENGAVVAPMPGRLVQVLVKEGQAVGRQEVVAVLEAMKTEQVIQAPHDGIVRGLAVAAGDQVQAGAVLLLVVGVE